VKEEKQNEKKWKGEIEPAPRALLGGKINRAQFLVASIKAFTFSCAGFRQHLPLLSLYLSSLLRF
jgi:hypothetical protein